MKPHSAQPALELSIVAPARNEEDNILPFIDEVAEAMHDSDVRFELIIVDDGSTDMTADRLRNASVKYEWLHVIRMTDRPSQPGDGKGAAYYAGFRHARAALIATIDTDLQNIPADIGPMLQLLRDSGADLVQGDRTANRRDNFVRRVSSLVGYVFRRWLLGDTIRDTACSLRVMRREVCLALPLEFQGMHRFIALTTRQLGYTVIEMPVHHRPRIAGKANYGIWNRAIPGLIDCFAVRWMRKRRRSVRFEELTAGPSAKSAIPPAPSKQEAAE